MRTSDVLRKAAAKLKKYGWAQGSFNYGIMRKPCCALGAISAITGNGKDLGSFYKARDRLKSVLGISGVTIWNDQVGRTASEVISALRRAARSRDEAKGKS